MTVAAAAALVAMAARFSEEMADRDHVVERGDALRQRSCELAEADARSYTAVLAAYRLPREDAGHRRRQIRAALETAADVPLAIVECAREVGRLGARLAVDGNPNLEGDAATAVNLAEAAARSAAHLIGLNIALGDLGGERSDRAGAWCAELRRAVRSLEDGSA
jgi:formiminotetrahydrofolate cyclodeaminase